MPTPSLYFHLAYINPGAGMLALQVFFAGVVGTAMVFRHRVLGLFRKKKQEDAVAPASALSSSPQPHDGKK